MTEIIAFPKLKVKKIFTIFGVINILEFEVVVVGDWLPRSFFGSFYLLFAAIRSIYLAVYLLICGFSCDAIIADQITFHLPLLKLCSRNGVLFYCHFPDKFLAPKGDGILRQGVYRRVLDWAEEECLALGADVIVVNSRFTQAKFKEAFASIKLVPEVLYPGVNVPSESEIDSKTNFRFKVILSLNRFERKKDLHFAIEAFKLSKSNDLKLILAGGYDSRVLENREHLKELQDLCDKLGLKHQTLFRSDYETVETIDSSETDVTFLPSISQETKQTLLKSSLALLYTPSNEHFGIVPIEAMSQGLPVIAMNSGGPKETVADGVGYLCEADSEDLARCIDKLLVKGKDVMGGAGKKRVDSLFSLKVFGDRLNSLLFQMNNNSKQKSQ